MNPMDKVNMVRHFPTFPSFQCVPAPTTMVFKGRNNAIKLLKLDLPLMGPEAVMDGLTRQL